MDWKKVVIVGILASLFFWVLFLNGPIRQIGEITNDHDDIDYYYFLMENDLTKISRLDFHNFYDTRMYFPSKNTLALGNNYLFTALVGLPVYLLTRNVILASNFAVLINVPVTFLAVYGLIYFLLKNVRAAIIAGVIYTYNPFAMSHLSVQAELAAMEFIPLMFLAGEGWLRRRSLLMSAVLVLIFFLCLTASFYYAFFLAVIFPVYLIFRARSLEIPIKKLVTFGMVVCLLVLTAVCYFYLAPFRQAQRDFNISRSPLELENFSAIPPDYFYAPVTNTFWGFMNYNELTSHFRPDLINVHYTEHSLLIGWVAIGLVLAGLYYWRKKKLTVGEKAIILPYLIVFLVAVYFSFGLYINLLVVKIPTLYWLIYKFVPGVAALRSLSRFVAVGYLGAVVIAAIGYCRLETKFWINKNIVLVVVLAFLFIGYRTFFPPGYEIPVEATTFYSWLNSQKEIKVIAELPIGNGFVAVPALDWDPAGASQYLLYALYHNKKLVDGYAGFVPPEKIKLGDYLTINFPTADKVRFLRKMGVDLVIVHLDEFELPESGQLVASGMEKIVGKEVYQTENIKAFRLN